MSDIDDVVQIGYLFNSLREPVFRSAIQALGFPLGSRGLDAGCGIGLQALLLAETVGPEGHVTGLDLSPEILDYARDVVNKAGLSESISFREGDVRELPFDDDTFDWAWSVDCVGYMPVEPLPLVKELARVVKPGGGGPSWPGPLKNSFQDIPCWRPALARHPGGLHLSSREKSQGHTSCAG